MLAAPDYAEGLAQWAEISAQLEIIARTAKRDAERHDKAGLFDSGEGKGTTVAIFPPRANLDDYESAGWSSDERARLTRVAPPSTTRV